MAESMNRIKENIFGRLFICLLLAAMLLSRFSLTAAADGMNQGINASGGMNIEPSVDPIENTEGFSTVLYNNGSGLPTSDANAIAQTNDGFIWIGSYAGLIRYDGNSFERIDSTSGIANVRCLLVDSHDRLWIGTNDSGVFLMTKGVLRNWNRSDGLRSVSIRALAEDGNGLIYIGGAAGGIALIDAGFDLTVLEDDRLEGQTVTQLRTGSDGLVYGRTQNCDLFALKDGAVEFFLGHNDCQVKDAHCLVPDPEHPGFLYVGTNATEVWYGELKSNFASATVTDISPLASVNSLEYVNGQIWVCAGNGAGRIDGSGFRTLNNTPMNNSVEHMMTDNGGNLWFASSHQGVMKIVPNQFSDLFERYGIPAAVVNSTCMYGRQLFIGTDMGLVVIEGDQRVESLPLASAVTASGRNLGAADLLEMLDGVRIRSIFKDSSGRLWIPAWRTYGVIRYDHGNVTAFTTEEGLFSNAVRVVSECEDGSILVANTGGLSVIRGDRVKKNYGEEDGIVNGAILTVTEGFNHEYILGSDGDGIYVITSEGTRRIGTEDGLRSEIILRIKQSRNRDLYWIVTGNSIAYMTPDYKVTTVSNFPYPNNYDLYETRNGDLWIISSAGIYVVSSEELLENGAIDPVFFGLQSGLPFIASANASSELTDNGDLYIASSEGVVKVNIEKPYEKTSRYKIALPYVEADGERIYPDLSGKFNLPAGSRKVTIYPYVFNYSLTDPQVSFRLSGFDTADTAVNRSKLLPVDYTNLKIGTYHFMITVKDSISRTEQTALFTIAKGKEMSFSSIGTIIMDAASMVMMIGILIFTSLYRKRGRVEDKLFFGLIMANMALAAGELLSYSLKYSSILLVRQLMILGNTVLYCALVLFPYLLFIYADYTIDPDKARIRKRKLIYAVPLLLFLILMMINLGTGWVFSIGKRNTYQSGILAEEYFLPLLTVCLYLLVSLVRVFIVNKRIALLSLLLILFRLAGELWIPGISSTSFLYTMFIVIIHLYVMDRPLTGEVA